MLFDTLQKTWQSTLNKNRFLEYSVCALALACLLMAYGVINKSVVVTLVPPTLTTDAQVGKNFASESYLEAWALFMSLALGNVTPESVRFIRHTIEPMLSPSVYQVVMKKLQQQADAIRANHVTLYFEPRRIVRESASGKIFVQGQSIQESATGQRQRTQRTYEFKIGVLNYLPSVSYIDTYTGEPRTIEEIERAKAAADRRLKTGFSVAVVSVWVLLAGCNESTPTAMPSPETVRASPVGQSPSIDEFEALIGPLDAVDWTPQQIDRAALLEITPMQFQELYAPKESGQVLRIKGAVYALESVLPGGASVIVSADGVDVIAHSALLREDQREWLLTVCGVANDARKALCQGVSYLRHTPQEKSDVPALHWGFVGAEWHTSTSTAQPLQTLDAQ